MVILVILILALAIVCLIQFWKIRKEFDYTDYRIECLKTDISELTVELSSLMSLFEEEQEEERMFSEGISNLMNYSSREARKKRKIDSSFFRHYLLIHDDIIKMVMI